MLQFLLLGVQGGLMGYVAGIAYPAWSWEFLLVLIANATLVTWYGIVKGKTNA
jgi:hypothetical protein